MRPLIYIFLLIMISCQTKAFVTTSSQINEMCKSIKIIESSALATASCELYISIKPLNPNNMVVGNVSDDIQYTFDGVTSWTTKN